MKRTLIALGTLASIAVISNTAWGGCEYGGCGHPRGGGGYHGGGGGFGAGAILGGVIGVIGGVIASQAQSQAQPKPEPYPSRIQTTRKSEPEKKKRVRAVAVPEPQKIKFSRAPPPVTPPKPPIAPAQLPPSPSPVASSDENRFVPDEVLLEVRNSISASTVDEIARQTRLTRISSQRLELAGSTVYRYRVTDGRPVPAVVQALEQDARIAATQPNFVYRLAESPTPNSMSGAQYAALQMRLSEAHRVSTGLGISVAVIDSGIDSTNPELAGSIADAFDAIDGAPRPHKHGTAVAGIIGSHARLMGVAPGVKLLAIRAFASGGGRIGDDGTTDHIVRSVEWAHQRGARVVNMSFTGPRDPLLSRELRAGKEKGIVFVAAAGNEGPNPAAADDSVIAVTASDATDRLYPAANRGPHVCLAAPGVEVMVPGPSGMYEFSSGTSMAAAHVSGAIALLLQSRPGLSPTAVRTVLLNRARHLSTETGSDGNCGIGVVDAFALVTEPGEKQGPELAGSATALVRRGEPSTVGISRTASPSTSQADQTKD